MVDDVHLFCVWAACARFVKSVLVIKLDKAHPSMVTKKILRKFLLMASFVDTSKGCAIRLLLFFC